jgi:hypothetical protein
MSLDATLWAWRQKIGKASAKLVLLSLADRADVDNCSFPSVETLSTDTELNRKTVLDALKHLKAIGLLEDTGGRRGISGRVVVYRMLGVESRIREPKRNQNRNSPKTGTVPKPDRNSPEIGTTNSPEIGTQNLKKEPISNRKKKKHACDATTAARFDSFWDSYPNKSSKGQAEKTFHKLNPDDLLLNRMISALHAQIDHRAAADAAGQWMPNWKNPSTWLNGKCWEDELPEITQQSQRRNGPFIPDDNDLSWADDFFPYAPETF